jgi:hypothetical protein
MTNTNYELTIGGKLRKVYKNSGGFFVKMNGGNLNVNNYFLKNGSGLKSKYKTKGGDANEETGIFDNLVEIKFTTNGNPVKVMVDSIIDHLNEDIGNLEDPISAEKIILFIYYKLFKVAKKNDKDELKALIEYVLFSFYSGYQSLNIEDKIKDKKYEMIDDNNINNVIDKAMLDSENFNKNDKNINWINNLFDKDGKFKEKTASSDSAAEEPASKSANAAEGADVTTQQSINAAEEPATSPVESPPPAAAPTPTPPPAAPPTRAAAKKKAVASTRELSVIPLYEEQPDDDDNDEDKVEVKKQLGEDKVLRINNDTSHSSGGKKKSKAKKAPVKKTKVKKNSKKM